MSSVPPQPPHFDRYVVIHVATTCDEHGVYVTKDSAEVIELGWIELDAKSLEEVRYQHFQTYANEAVWSSATVLTCFLTLDSPRECACETHQHSYHSSLQ